MHNIQHQKGRGIGEEVIINPSFSFLLQYKTNPFINSFMLSLLEWLTICWSKFQKCLINDSL